MYRNSSEVEQFLKNLFADRDIIRLPVQVHNIVHQKIFYTVEKIFQDKLGPWIARRRTPSIIEKYNEIGGGSPIYEWTRRQVTLTCDWFTYPQY